jgi:hypothetical protein
MISIEATGSEGTVFSLSGNGNVFVTDNGESLNDVRAALGKSLEFVDRWLSGRPSETRSACTPSKV